MKNSIWISLLFVLFSACTYDPIDKNTLFINENEVSDIIKNGRLYDINELLDSFMTERGNYFDSTQTYRTRSYKMIGVDTFFLFSIDTLPKAGPDIYIRGRVTTDDLAGNFYKAMVIQQIVNGEQQALRISVDMGSLGGLYAKGQEILIRCNGLAIGKYANQPQLCVPSYDNKIYANKAEEKVGWAPGRIPSSLFNNATYKIGLPDVSKIQYDEYTIEEIVGKNTTMNEKCAYLDQITTLDEARKKDGLAIVVKNLHCTGEYANTSSSGPEIQTCNVYNSAENNFLGDPNKDTKANVFAPTTDNMNYPQGRLFADQNDNPSNKVKQRSVIKISTSEYAKYAHYYLPAKISRDTENDILTFDYTHYSGDVYGILSFYMDNARYDADKFAWSITPSSLYDLHLQDSNGVQWQNADLLEFSKY